MQSRHSVCSPITHYTMYIFCTSIDVHDIPYPTPHAGFAMPSRACICQPGQCGLYHHLFHTFKCCRRFFQANVMLYKSNTQANVGYLRKIKEQACPAAPESKARTQIKTKRKNLCSSAKARCMPLQIMSRNAMLCKCRQVVIRRPKVIV